jgi:hypothetical protein
VVEKALGESELLRQKHSQIRRWIEEVEVHGEGGGGVALENAVEETTTSVRFELGALGFESARLADDGGEVGALRFFGVWGAIQSFLWRHNGSWCC